MRGFRGVFLGSFEREFAKLFIDVRVSKINP